MEKQLMSKRMVFVASMMVANLATAHEGNSADAGLMQYVQIFSNKVAAVAMPYYNHAVEHAGKAWSAGAGCAEQAWQATCTRAHLLQGRATELAGSAVAAATPYYNRAAEAVGNTVTLAQAHPHETVFLVAGTAVTFYLIKKKYNDYCDSLKAAHTPTYLNQMALRIEELGNQDLDVLQRDKTTNCISSFESLKIADTAQVSIKDLLELHKRRLIMTYNAVRNPKNKSMDAATYKMLLVNIVESLKKQAQKSA